MTGLRDQVQSSLGSTYVLERELAGGGMSRVFVAREIALDRQVVVKVLPPEMSAAVSAERFKREIALAAKLQHPHIVPVLAAGDVGGVPYYTMPFVDGESLRARLTREGELPFVDAVSILREVARALVYAHERGIVHRDVKPDNVLLSAGSVMVTDFGVAKALSASTSGGSAPLTELGVALGTPAYMAPEQASAEPTVDHRADLYAFGCMAYELITGQTPFAGRPGPSQLAAQVSETPESVVKRRPNTPAPLAALVMQCLEKRPADRPRDAQDVLRVLEAIVLTPSALSSVVMQATTPREPLPRRASRVLVSWIAPLFVGAALTAAAFVWRGEDALPQDGPVIRVPIAFTDELRFSAQPRAVAMSPDGQTAAFIGLTPSGRRIFVRRLDQTTQIPVTASAPFTQLYFSYDGKWILALHPVIGRWMRVPVDGGKMEVVDSLREPTLGASWGEGDTIVVALRSSGLATVAAFGERSLPHVRVRPDTVNGEFVVRWPLLLPDGRTVVYTRLDSSGAAASAKLAVASLETGSSRSLDLPGTCPLGLVDDYLVYGNASGDLMAVPFDVQRARLTGNALPLLEGIPTTGPGCPQAAMSRSGSLIYESSRGSTQIVEADERGVSRPIIALPGTLARGRYSPDGKRIVLHSAELGNSRVAIYDVASGTTSPLLAAGTFNASPEWSPDGKQLLLVTNRRGLFELWSQPWDGSGSGEVILTLSGSLQRPNTSAVFTPDGASVVVSSGGGGGGNYYVHNLRGDTATRAYRGFGTVLTGARVSPDGKWIAYATGDPPDLQVYVQPFAANGSRVKVSTTYGAQPIWSRDGRRLYYRSTNDTLMVADVRLTPAFEVLSRRVLFKTAATGTGTGLGPGSYDVSPDGKRILMTEPATLSELTVIHNWAAQVRARMRQQSRR